MVAPNNPSPPHSRGVKTILRKFAVFDEYTVRGISLPLWAAMFPKNSEGELIMQMFVWRFLPVRRPTPPKGVRRALTKLFARHVVDEAIRPRPDAIIRCVADPIRPTQNRTETKHASPGTTSHTLLLVCRPTDHLGLTIYCPPSTGCS